MTKHIYFCYIFPLFSQSWYLLPIILKILNKSKFFFLFFKIPYKKLDSGWEYVFTIFLTIKIIIKKSEINLIKMVRKENHIIGWWHFFIVFVTLINYCFFINNFQRISMIIVWRTRIFGYILKNFKLNRL